MHNLLCFLFIVLLLEIFLYLLIYYQKKNFQWLITKKDEFPVFENKKTERFFKKSFNKNLGWLQKPFVKDFHDKTKKRTKFSINKFGARTSNYSHFKKKIEAYGDSFVFGRYVNNHNVWTEILSKEMGYNVINYGVGNYGFDQALLRLEMNKKKNSAYTIIGVVPETINRINSIWKHYLEFGNIYAFKPSFFINKKKLLLRKNPIKNVKDFDNKKIIKIINKVSKMDFFYENKFKKFQFQNSYILSFLRNFNFNCKLFIKFIFMLLKKQKDKKKYLFPLYYSNNIEFANHLYLDKKSTNLFRLLINRFIKSTKKKNSIPIIIIFPQKADIDLYRKKKNNYCNFFNSIKNITIIDLTKFLSKQNIQRIFLDPEHGGHLTVYGNKIVAKQIQKELKKNV
tara:strand:- start:257 stop:1447 length:1191 start_codon:yes stop_codon:yes gene_type:complete